MSASEEAAGKREEAAGARGLLRKERQGALATLSLHKAGWPFGSIAPYALSARAEPLLLMSALAQHTKNALADPRASLLVQDSAGLAPRADSQAHQRVTLLGHLSAVQPAGEPEARARYLARHPQAARTAQGHDFHFYSLSIEEARSIGGFGRIGWIPGAAMLVDPAQDPLLPHREAICRHMNGDHGGALALYCQRFRALSGEAARMLSVDTFGFDVEQGPAEARERVRFDFDEPLATPDEVRRALVAMSAAARAG